jgi:hypothetical protein
MKLMNLQERVLEYAGTVHQFTLQEVADAEIMTMHQADAAMQRLLRAGKVLVVRAPGRDRSTGIYSTKIGTKHEPIPFNERRLKKEKSAAPKPVRGPKLSPIEQSWRELRATMGVKQVADPYDYSQKRLVWGKQNSTIQP